MANNTYTTATLIEGEVRASAAFSTSTSPTLAQVNGWIEEESKEIEINTGMVFASTAISSELNDYRNVDNILRFPKTPLLSVDKIEYNVNSNNVAASWVTLETGNGYNYLEYLDEGEVEFISGNLASNKISINDGKKKLRLSYTYGYTTTPLEIQKLTTLLVARRIINSLLNDQANTEGGSIQVGTIRVTDPTNFSVSYIQSMNDNINDLYSSIGQKFRTFRGTRVY